MGTTIRDVARHAGVSISTVSRVLNNTCPVDVEKQKAVKRAVSELGYIPNPAARSLHSRKTGGLGILLPFVSGEFFSEFLSAVDETAQKEGFFLLISTSHYSSADLNKALQGMHRRVDGLLVMAPLFDNHHIDHSLFSEQTTVFVNTHTNGDQVDSLTFDNYGGMYAMTAHLLSKGHRRIAFIKGPDGTFDSQERLNGYLNALRDTGVESDADMIVPGGYTLREGYNAAKQLLSHKRLPEAIMASNDYAALGVIHALREENIATPSQIAVTGFDDVPSAMYSMPSLSTVHVPLRELGTAATNLLLDRINQKSARPRQQLTLPVQLVIRDST